MIKTIAASQAAKALALCVCPVVTAGVVATKVPQVRKMVHKATSPKKPVRQSAALARAKEPPCNPVLLADGPLRSSAALPTAVGLPLADLPVLPTTASTGPAGSADGGVGYTGPGFGNIPPSFISGGGGGGGFVPAPPGGIGGTTPGGGIIGGGPVGGGTVGGVPEPAVWAQMGGAFLVLGATVRYTRKPRRSVEA